jgi:hypothetical protein
VRTHLSAATAAAADRRGHAALDGGSKTRLPTVVRREMMATCSLIKFVEFILFLSKPFEYDFNQFRVKTDM